MPLPASPRGRPTPQPRLEAGTGVNGCVAGWGVGLSVSLVYLGCVCMYVCWSLLYLRCVCAPPVYLGCASLVYLGGVCTPGIFGVCVSLAYLGCVCVCVHVRALVYVVCVCCVFCVVYVERCVWCGI